MKTSSSGFRSFALVMGLILVFSLVRLEKAPDEVTQIELNAEGIAGGIATDDLALDGDAATGAASGSSGSSGTGSAAKKATTTGGGGTTGGRAGTGGSAGSGGSGGRAGGTSGGAGGTAGGGSGGGGTGSGSGGGGLECAAGKNGGDLGGKVPGVTATKIKLATTAVLDGPAKTLLEPSVTGMKAVLDKVNRSGGVCGRTLELKVVNDNFNAAQGQAYIRNFISEDYFALPVVPSAEGLGSAIEAGDIKNAGIPVIGTDGMRREQYTDPWVWPVASATVTSMRTMARYGYRDQGARTFAIVYDTKYKFGKEGLDAFTAQVRAEGGTLVHAQGLDPDQGNYPNEVQTFNGRCGGEKCDMVAYLLLPDTAKQWLARNPARAKLYQAGAQTLFTDRFAQDCVQAIGESCNGFAVWTGYNPPIGALAARPGLAAYVADIRATDPNNYERVITNQFLMGSYLGMSVFVEALKKVGPNLSREALRDAMNSMTFQSDLASTLTWSANDHKANKSSQSFTVVYGQGGFSGWRPQTQGFLPDPASSV